MFAAIAASACIAGTTCFTAGTACFTAGTAWAQKPNSDIQARQYRTCLSLATKRPREAMDVAVSWIARKGGAPAEHCQAVALLGLGRPAEAARLLERIADNRADPMVERLQADLMGQAGNAWLVAGKPEAARRALTRALARRPEDADFLIDRGIAHASLKQHWQALTDLSRALKLDPDRIEALVYRATVYRRMGELDLAHTDARLALAIRPGHPEALMESGMVLRLKGDRDGARRTWRTLVKTAPENPLAEMARRRLVELDKAARQKDGQPARRGN